MPHTPHSTFKHVFSVDTKAPHDQVKTSSHVLTPTLHMTAQKDESTSMYALVQARTYKQSRRADALALNERPGFTREKTSVQCGRRRAPSSAAASDRVLRCRCIALQSQANLPKRIWQRHNSHPKDILKNKEVKPKRNPTSLPCIAILYIRAHSCKHPCIPSGCLSQSDSRVRKFASSDILPWQISP